MFNSLNELFSLEGKTAVITGAAGYFGRTFSKCLLKAGAKIIILGRGEKITNFAVKLAQETYAKPASIFYHDVDFYNTDKYEKQLKDIVKKHETIDVLVNNAYDFSKDTGFNDQSGRIENISKHQIMRSLEAGVFWHVLATQIIGEKMKESENGSIINIGSMYAHVSPSPSIYKDTDRLNPPCYGISKGGMLSFTRYAAAFYGEYGIRVNTLSIGACPNIEDSNAFNAPKDDFFTKRLEDKTVLGRTAKTTDLIGALIFLASDCSSYITGESIAIDGGWTIT